MFDSWNQWVWVSIAWAQVVLAYVGYLIYLGWRHRRLLDDDRVQRLVQSEAVANEAASR
ncbi:hypothetical protein BH23DEI1_BH23DEI1_01390 [soil metagenome]|nr:hypothetical protein [Trueperaceae bacterium]